MEQVNLDSEDSKSEKNNHSEEKSMASRFCDPQLRDPLTVAVTYMRNPGRFRVCCKFTKLVWEQTLYLEVQLPCPYMVLHGHSPSGIPKEGAASSGIEEDDFRVQKLYRFDDSLDLPKIS